MAKLLRSIFNNKKKKGTKTVKNSSKKKTVKKTIKKTTEKVVKKTTAIKKPKKVVEKLGIKPGDELNFEIKNEEVTIQKQEAIKENKKNLTEAEIKLLQELINMKHSDRKTNEGVR